jgi:threonine dehydrogenase-like Zn-dependent dehydrogenase
MKAVVWYDQGDIRLEDVPEPKIKNNEDAIVRLTASAICGTDLHMIRGTMPGMKKGTILGHEGVGIVEEVGSKVRNFRPGDRVVIGSTIACGACSYCRAGYFAQCDRANPNGKDAGTAFFGGPQTAGGFDGMQAEKVRVPFAHTTMVKVPEEVRDDQAILISDIFPTGYFGADLAEIEPGRNVAVFGCGPVGQFAIASAKLMGAGRIFAVDTIASRLDMARAQGAEAIDFNREDPVEVIKELTNGIGADRAIDAVGVDANRPHSGPAKPNAVEKAQFAVEQKMVAPSTDPHDGNWEPGDAPSQVPLWIVKGTLCKAGKASIIGVYPDTMRSFPFGQALNRNLTIRMGNCNHRRYIPKLLDMVSSGLVHPEKILTHVGPLTSALEAYKNFDKREAGWIKVELEPRPAPARAA